MLHYIIANCASPHLESWRRVYEAEGLDTRFIDIGPISRRRGEHPLTIIRAAVKLAGQLIRVRFDRSPHVNHAHGAGAAGVLAIAAGQPRVTIVHGTEVHRTQLARGTLIALRTSAMVNVMGRETERRVKELIGRSRAHRVNVYHPGADLSLFVSKRDEAPSDTLRVCSLRRLSSDLYRVVEIVEACAIVAKKRDVRLTLLLGDASATSGYVREVFRTVEANPHLKVDFVEGFLDRSDLAKLLLRQDIAVSIPRSDQLSSVVLEAITAGCRLVYADIPTYAPLQKNGPREWAVTEPLEIPALAKAVVAAAESDEPVLAMTSDQRGQELIASLRDLECYSDGVAQSLMHRRPSIAKVARQQIARLLP